MNKQILNQIICDLMTIAVITVNNCTFSKKVNYFHDEKKVNILLPSGDEKYGSFWVRDVAMMAESGLISDDDLKKYVEILATYAQNGSETRILKNGLEIPPYAIADHVNYDGEAVFFPGTYSSGDDQGNGSFGYFPPFCDNYYFIMMVGYYIKQSGNISILHTNFRGMPLLKRLEYAFVGYNIDADSGLCVSDSKRYTVDWGFVDTVRKSGKLLMASLLRYNAAIMLSYILELCGEADSSKGYFFEAQKVKSSVLETFYDTNTGWLYSATGICHQYDVWATAYAVYSGITEEETTLKALYLAYKNRTAVVDGYVRHILTDHDYSASTAWESTATVLNEYQNGAYWSTPTGWYAYAIYKYNSETDILADFIKHTKKYAEKGAPFEWMDASSNIVSGLKYGTSGILPYIGAKRIWEDSSLSNG